MVTAMTPLSSRYHRSSTFRGEMRAAISALTWHSIARAQQHLHHGPICLRLPLKCRLWTVHGGQHFNIALPPSHRSAGSCQQILVVRQLSAWRKRDCAACRRASCLPYRLDAFCKFADTGFLILTGLQSCMECVITLLPRLGGLQMTWSSTRVVHHLCMLREAECATHRLAIKADCPSAAQLV